MDTPIYWLGEDYSGRDCPISLWYYSLNLEYDRQWLESWEDTWQNSQYLWPRRVPDYWVDPWEVVSCWVWSTDGGCCTVGLVSNCTDSVDSIIRYFMEIISFESDWTILVRWYFELGTYVDVIGRLGLALVELAFESLPLHCRHSSYCKQAVIASYKLCPGIYLILNL